MLESIQRHRTVPEPVDSPETFTRRGACDRMLSSLTNRVHALSFLFTRAQAQEPSPISRQLGVNFNDNINCSIDIVPTRDLHLVVNYEPQEHAGLYKSAINKEDIVDIFTKSDRAKKTRGGPLAKEIEGRWVMMQMKKGAGLSACLAMLCLDVNPSASVQALLKTSCKLEDAGEVLRGTDLYVNQLSSQGQEYSDFLLSYLKRDEKTESWRSLIVVLKPPHHSSRPVIVDAYDGVTGLVFIRDPSQALSFSMHVDDFCNYRPKDRCISIVKVLSRSELRDISSYKYKVRKY